MTVESATPADGSFDVLGRVNIVNNANTALTINAGNLTNVFAVAISNVGAGTAGVLLQASDGGGISINPCNSGDGVNNQIVIGSANRTQWFQVANQAYDASPHAFMTGAGASTGAGAGASTGAASLSFR